MPYVTSFERFAQEKGREEGYKRGIREILRLRFGDDGVRLMTEIDPIRDGRVLETIMDEVGRASSLQELRGRWKPAEDDSGS